MGILTDFLFTVQMCKTRLGHVHLKVRDLQRSIDFYNHFLGLSVTERVGDQYAFLGNSTAHHELALQYVGRQTQQPPSTCSGLYHLAFEVPDQESFVRAYNNLTCGGIEAALVDHLISWTLDFRDPDGNSVEIYWDTREEAEGQELWRGRNIVLSLQRLTRSKSNNTGIAER